MNTNFKITLHGICLVNFLFLSACNLSVRNDTAPEVTPMLNAGDSCGLTGTTQERVSDCSRAPDSEVEHFKLALRTNTGNKVWLDMSTGILVGGILPSKLSFVDAQKSCRDLSSMIGFSSALTFRVATISELTKLLPNRLTAIAESRHKEFLTSDHNEDGWINVLNGDTLQVEGPAHPETFHSHALCVATLGTMEITHTTKLKGPFFSATACETYITSSSDEEDALRAITQHIIQDAEFRCGGIVQKKTEIKSGFRCKAQPDHNTWNLVATGKLDFNCF